MQYKLFLLLTLTPMLTMCQPISINGKVISIDNEPIPGATVTIKRTGETTLTNNLGEFTFPSSHVLDTIVVSAANYETQEVPNNERGQLKIIMIPSSTSLQEVVINTGYQQLPKERVNGSFEKITTDQIHWQLSPNLIERMDGLVSSLLTNRKTNEPGIMIRGRSTIQGPAAPLIILDNFPYEGDINNINPNDIETITILKDAAAASIWGARAGNGVIVITSKKTRFNTPLSVDLVSGITTAPEPDLHYMQTMSPADFIEVEKFLFSKNFLFADTASNTKPPFSPAYEIMFRQRKGLITAEQADLMLQELAQSDLRDQFSKYFYRSPFHQQHSVTLRSGAKNISLLFCAGFDKGIDELHAPSDRLTLRTENIFVPIEKLQFSTSVYYTYSRTEDGRPGWGSIFTRRVRLPSYTRFADDEGNPLPLYKDYRQTYIDTAGAGKLLDWNYYPLTDHLHTSNFVKGHHLLASFGLKYKVLKGLNADLRYQYEQQDTDRENLQDINSYFTRNQINLFSQINRSTGVVRHVIPLGAILENNNSRLFAHNLRGQLTYDLHLLDHKLSLLAGAEMRDRGINSRQIRSYGYNPENKTASSVDYTNAYPLFVSGISSFITPVNSFGETANHFISYYANAAYTFKDKYILTGSVRKDQSNILGVKTNEKGVPLWSAGLGWLLSSESFYNLSVLPYLKLRATYGFSGNVDPSRSALSTIRFIGNNSISGLPNANINQFPNPELRWEKVRMINFGIDFNSRNSRVGGSIEYYSKQGLDLFARAPIDYTAGVGATIIRNAGAIKGSGIDITINTININRRLRWHTTFIFNYSSTVVTRNYLGTLNASRIVNSGEAFSAQEGQPFYAMYSYRWAGLDPQTGDPIGYLNGQESKDYNAILTTRDIENDIVYSGLALPPYFGSLRNTFAFKNFSLTASLVYKLGYYFRRQSLSYIGLYNTNDGHADYTLRWQKQGDEQFTNVPSMIYPAVGARDDLYLESEALVEKADHLRLQFVNLTYDLNRSLLKKLPVKLLQLYANAGNIAIIWRANKHNIDPDYSVTTIPTARNYSFGIRCTF